MRVYLKNLIIPFLFFLSGSAGLIYEVIWKELLTNLLGSSTVAITIILASFMIGLATGSLIIGKKADNWNIEKTARFYIIIEILIALYALSLPTILENLEFFYIDLYTVLPTIMWSSIFLKSFFAMAMLFIPTFLMGTTLPLITKYLSATNENYSNNISLLYGLNTLGAILGTIIAGFYLLENFGISGATKFSATINIIVALCFLLIYKFYKTKSSEKINKKDKKTKLLKEKFDEFSVLLLISYMISGASSMFYQVSWTRSLSLIIGTSTYAFTIMLTTFLLGIAIGSIIFRYIPKTISKIKLYIFTQLLIALSVLITTPFMDDLPLYYLSLNEQFFNSWSDLHYIRFLLAGLIMIIPTISMGILFPIVCDILINRNKKMTDNVGKAYAYTSIGATLGAIISGLLVIPLIGIQNTIYTAIFLNIFAAFIILLQSKEFNKKLKAIFIFSPLLIFSFALYKKDTWNPKIMSSGVYVYKDNYFSVSNRLSNMNFSNNEIWKSAMNNYQLLYYQDGITDSVSVMKNMDGVISLMVNGKVDASAKSEHDIATQLMIGQLPLLLHKNPKDIFLVGYASGITAGSILTHPVKSLDTAEISTSIVEASKLFNKYNYNPLNDKRMNLQIKDARHMLMVSNKKYDVIVSQPSNPWIKGQSSLFSFDWYKIVKEHLKDDGLFMQWIPAYHISERNLKIIINTLDKSFPNLTLWSSSVPGDLIILASNNKNFSIPYEVVKEKFKIESVKSVFDRINLNTETLFRDIFLKGDKEIKEYLYKKDKNLPINTDDKLITEYTAPKNMINSSSVEVFIKSDSLDINEDTLERIIKDLPR